MFDTKTEIIIVAFLVGAWLIAWAWKIWGPASRTGPAPRGALRRDDLAVPAVTETVSDIPLRVGTRKPRQAPPALTAAGQARPVFRMMRGRGRDRG